MNVDRRNYLNIGIFLSLCGLLGWFSPELRQHLPGITGGLVDLALFLGLLALLGYAKSRKR
jgi:hypothetical protein